MEQEKLEKMLRDSALSGYELPKSKEDLKSVLINLNHPYRYGISTTKLWRAAGILSGCLFVAAAFFIVIEDNEQPGPSNNLGGIWSTYTDSAKGGSSTVWPPASISCRNLFEKSSPGYGDKGYAVRITGKAGDVDGAFLGVNTFLSERSACPRCIGIDLRKYRGIRFMMKGVCGKGRLLFILPHQSQTATPDQSSCMTLTGDHDYQADITGHVKKEWIDVKLAFGKDFTQPANTPDSQQVAIETVLEDENLLQWRWYGEQNQTIDLWIDNVELF
jgi:hypothetical protein